MAQTEPGGVAPAPSAAPASGAPANVIAALARVEGEVGGIEKKHGGDGGIQYAFRGIDAISTIVQPLFAKYGVVVVPNVVEHSITEITVNGRPWTDGTLVVDWNIYGPGGPQDMIRATTVGLGRDNSEKTYAKAMTQAYKNLILRLLCIGDPEDDTDGVTHERDAGSSGPRAAAPARNDEPREITKAQECAAAFSSLDGEQKKLVSTHAKTLGVTNVMRSGEHAEDLLAFINALGSTTGIAGDPPVEAEPEEAF